MIEPLEDIASEYHFPCVALVGRPLAAVQFAAPLLSQRLPGWIPVATFEPSELIARLRRGRVLFPVVFGFERRRESGEVRKLEGRKKTEREKLRFFSLPSSLSLTIFLSLPPPNRPGGQAAAHLRNKRRAGVGRNEHVLSGRSGRDARSSGADDD